MAEQPVNKETRIWVGFSTVTAWVATPQGQRPCTSKCGLCKLPWGSIPENLNVNYLVNRQGRPVYFCDPCLNILVNGNPTEAPEGSNAGESQALCK